MPGHDTREGHVRRVGRVRVAGILRQHQARCEDEPNLQLRTVGSRLAGVRRELEAATRGDLLLHARPVDVEHVPGNRDASAQKPELLTQLVIPHAVRPELRRSGGRTRRRRDRRIRPAGAEALGDRAVDGGVLVGNVGEVQLRRDTGVGRAPVERSTGAVGGNAAHTRHRIAVIRVVPCPDGRLQGLRQLIRHLAECCVLVDVDLAMIIREVGRAEVGVESVVGSRVERVDVGCRSVAGPVPAGQPLQRPAAGRGEAQFLAVLPRVVVLGNRSRPESKPGVACLGHRGRARERPARRRAEEPADVELHGLGNVLGLVLLAVPVGGGGQKLERVEIVFQGQRDQVEPVGEGLRDVERLVVRLVHRRTIDRVRAVLGNLLVHVPERGAEAIVRLGEQRRPPSTQVFPVGTRDLRPRRDRRDVTARRTVVDLDGKGVQYRAVDPTVDALVRADES